MASPKLQALIKLTELLEAMSVEDGYSRDYAGIVYRGRQLFGQESGATALTIVEYPRSDAPDWAGNNQVLYEQWQVLVQGWTRPDTKHPTDPLYPMLDDVESCLFRCIAQDEKGDPADPDAWMLGNIASQMRIGPGIVRAADQTSSKAFFYLTLQIDLARQAG